MDIFAVNWVAILIAAVASWLFGAAWYMSLSKQWLKATRIDLATHQRSVSPFIISFVAEILMALVFSLLLGGLTFGEPTVVTGMIYGFVFWLGFVFTSIGVNNRYEGFGWDLTVLDTGHWLGVLLIMGAVIGWFGGPSIE